MNWEPRYLPPDPTIWHGRADTPEGSCFYQHIKPINLLTQTPEKLAPITFALLGFKCDEGAQRELGRTGASEGPTAIRQCLGRLPMQKTTIAVYDAGNIVCTDHDLETSQQALAEVIALLQEKNIHPIVLGGGHEVAFGHYQGLALSHANERRLGMINFDAHFDLEPLKQKHGSSRTTFYQIAKAHHLEKRRFDYNCVGIQPAGNTRQMFDLAKDHAVKYILADELHQDQQDKCVDFVDRVIDENDIIYVSISMDVFSPAYAPGVSAVQPLGLQPWHVIPLLRQVAASGKVVSYEIAEHVPRYDIDHRTAKLAAALVYEIVHHHHEPYLPLVSP